MEEVEKWKVIEGFDGKYVVSSFGKVWSFKSTRFIFSSSYLLDSYSLVSLCGDGFTRTTGIHVLVAEAFIPNPENKPEVNHVDGIKCNNHVSNLEWATKSENQIHSCTVLHPNRKEKRDNYLNSVLGQGWKDEIDKAYREWEATPAFKAIKSKYALMYQRTHRAKKRQEILLKDAYLKDEKDKK